MMMNTRRHFLSMIGGVIGSTALTIKTLGMGAMNAADQKMQKPNVIVCLCDQLRSFEVGCYGNPVIQTPNIDRLAQNGVRFETAVTNNPVCSPARSILLSGQHSRTATGTVTNCGDPESYRKRLPKPTLAEIFKQHAYETALIGKWHIEPKPSLLGFETAVYPDIEHTNYGQTYYDENDKSFTVEEFAPYYEINKVKEFLTARPKENPFLLYYNISPPHGPIGKEQLPKKYSKMYDPAGIPLRQNTKVDPDSDFLYAQWYEDIKPEQKNNPKTWAEHYRFWFNTYCDQDYFWDWYNEKSLESKLPENFSLEDLTAFYYGATTCVDDMVGQMVESLKENNLLDNTIIVFASDHGDNLGSHGQFNKDILLEESIRIPMIFHWPAKLKPSVNKKQIAQIIDITPTLLDLCDLQVPDYMQGQSLKPIVYRNKESLEKNWAFIETDTWQIGIRTPEYLYGMKLDRKTNKITDDRLYFFDLTADPYQKNNLAKTSTLSKTAEELRHKLTEYYEQMPKLAWKN